MTTSSESSTEKFDSSNEFPYASTALKNVDVPLTFEIRLEVEIVFEGFRTRFLLLERFENGFLRHNRIIKHSSALASWSQERLKIIQPVCTGVPACTSDCSTSPSTSLR